MLSAANHKAEEAAGAALFHERGCARCHGEQGEGAKKGPALTGLRKQKQWTAARITEQITNGGQKMPPFGEALTPEETRLLTALVRAKHWPKKQSIVDGASVKTK